MKRIQKIYDNFYKDITEYKSWKKKEFDLFFKNIILSDPSFNKKYSRWLCEIFLKKGFLEEDIIGENNKIFETLSIYDKNKNKIQKNLNQYDSIGSLWKDIKDFSSLTLRDESKEAREKAYQESHIILREKRTMLTDNGEITDDFIIVSPLTEDAAKWWGKGTRWCTSAEDNNMFATYNKDAPLIIFIMPNKEKLQFHYHENDLSFMDENDDMLSNEYIEKHFDFFKEIFYKYKAFFHFPESYIKNSLKDKKKDEWLKSSDEFISGYVQSLESENIIHIPKFLEEFLFKNLSIKEMYYGSEIENNFITNLISKNKIFKHSLNAEFQNMLSHIDWSKIRNEEDNELTMFIKTFILTFIENNSFDFNMDVPELRAFEKFHHILRINQFEGKDLNNLDEIETKIFNKILQLENVRWKIPPFLQEKKYIKIMIDNTINNCMNKKSFNDFFVINYDKIESTSKTTNSEFIKNIQKIEKETGENIFDDNDFYNFGIRDYTSLISVDQTKLTDETFIKILKENPRNIIAFKNNLHKIPYDLRRHIVEHDGALIHYFLDNCSQNLIDLSLKTTGIFSIPKEKYNDYNIKEDDLSIYYKNAILHDYQSIRFVPESYTLNFNEEEKNKLLPYLDISHWKQCNIEINIENIKNVNKNRLNFYFYKENSLNNFSLDEQKTLFSIGVIKILNNLKKNNVEIGQDMVINCVKSNPRNFLKLYKEEFIMPETLEYLTEYLLEIQKFPDNMLFTLKTEKECEKVKKKDNIFSMPDFYVEKFIKNMTIEDLIDIYDIDEGIACKNKSFQELFFYKSQELFLEKKPDIQFKL